MPAPPVPASVPCVPGWAVGDPTGMLLGVDVDVEVEDCVLVLLGWCDFAER